MENNNEAKIMRSENEVRINELATMFNKDIPDFSTLSDEEVEKIRKAFEKML